MKELEEVIKALKSNGKCIQSIEELIIEYIQIDEVVKPKITIRKLHYNYNN